MRNKSILLIILTILMCTPLIFVKALNVKTLSVSETESGKITISGTTDDGVYAVAIQIYNEDESELVTMRTVAVDDDNKYSDSITLAAKTYVIKVADYNGGNFAKATVKPNVTTTDVVAEEEKETAKEATPETSDNIITYIILGVVSLVSIILAIVYFKKEIKN